MPEHEPNHVPMHRRVFERKREQAKPTCLSDGKNYNGYTGKQRGAEWYGAFHVSSKSNGKMPEN